MKYLCSILCVLILFGCTSSTHTSSGTPKIYQRSFDIVQRRLMDEADIITDVKRNIQDTSPNESGILESSANSLLSIAAHVQGLGIDFVEQNKELINLNEKVRKLQDAQSRQGNWIFLAGIALGILGTAGSVYAAIQSFSLKTLGFAGVSFFVTAISAGFLWYGHLIALVALGLMVVIMVVVLIAIATKWKSILRNTMNSFDRAELEVEDSHKEVIREFKQSWGRAQRDIGAQGAINDIRKKLK